MKKLVVVLGTTHEVQNGENYWRRIDDPQFRELLKILVDEERIEFIFEEAAGMGPTDAEKLSATLVSGRYLNVDPPRNEREKSGIPEDTNRHIFLGSPMVNPPTARTADWVFHEAHAKREEYWLQRIATQDFMKALMICGQNHALSLSFRLQALGFDVKTVAYAPPLPTDPESQNLEENLARTIINQINRSAGELGLLLKASTVKKDMIGEGITIRHLTDQSILVCDYSGHCEPRWYERNSKEWQGEGEEGKKRLAETKGTVWVVTLSPFQFCVFETQRDAEKYSHTLLSDNPRSLDIAVNRYVDGERQIH